MPGFVEVVVRRRRRGRPTERRVIRLHLRDGTRLSIGDSVPPELMRGVLRVVLRTTRC